MMCWQASPGIPPSYCRALQIGVHAWALELVSHAQAQWGLLRMVNS
jgi:hypothetical protein